MTRFAMNEITTYRWTFDQDVREYAAAGIEAISVWRQKLSDFGEQRAIELLAESGLQVSSVLWAGGFTGSDGRSHRESIDDAIEALRTAAALNAHCLVVYTGGRAGHTHKHARRLIRGALEEIEPLAAQLGVVLAVEPMHPGCAAEWTFLTTLDDTLNFLDELGDGSVCMVFDTYHLGEEEGLLQRLPEITARIALVQLGDTKQRPWGEQNRCLLGEGRLPLRNIVAALMDAGYTGFYEVELMGEEIETADYRQLLTHSQQAFNELISVTS